MAGAERCCERLPRVRRECPGLEGGRRVVDCVTCERREVRGVGREVRGQRQTWSAYTRIHVRMRKYEYAYTLYGVRIWAYTRIYGVFCVCMRDYASEIRFPLKNGFFVTGVAQYAVRCTRVYSVPVYPRIREFANSRNLTYRKHWENVYPSHYCGACSCRKDRGFHLKLVSDRMDDVEIDDDDGAFPTGMGQSGMQCGCGGCDVEERITLVSWARLVPISSTTISSGCRREMRKHCRPEAWRRCDNHTGDAGWPGPSAAAVAQQHWLLSRLLSPPQKVRNATAAASSATEAA
jgi:hypothetical protein